MADKISRDRSLRSPGEVVDRHAGYGIMPNWIVVALDKDPSVRARLQVPKHLRLPAVGEHVVLVRTKAGDFRSFEPDPRAG